MTRVAVHFGALDAEPRWRPAGAATLPEARDSGAQRIIAAMEELHWGFTAPGDAVLGPALDDAIAEVVVALGSALPVEAPRGAIPSPYAVVPDVPELVARHGLCDTLPSLDVVRRVNGKTFSNALARALGLEGVADVGTSTAELDALVERCLAGGAAVVKDPYGVSGRGVWVVSDRAAWEGIAAHLRRQERAGRSVEMLVQPLLPRAADFSCHFEVMRGGLRVLGVQQMDNDGMAFRSVAQPSAALLEQLERSGQWGTMEAVATALEREGYTGPVCVDAMVLTDGRVVPLLEINARKSMGLLHLSLRRRFQLASHDGGRPPIPPGPAGESELAVWSLTLRRGVESAALLSRLREHALLFDGRRGLLPLAAGTLHANAADLASRGVARARLYGLLAWEDAAGRARLLAGAAAALAELGAQVDRGPR